MATPLKIIVLASNYRAYTNYLYANAPTTKEQYNYVYGGNIFAIRGCKASQVVVVDGFWDREDAQELYREANSRLVEDKASIKKVAL